MFLILLGAPGSGKGTQAQKICAHYNLPHISTGDIFRQDVKQNTLSGIAMAHYINEGKLVPDEIVIKIVKERLSQDDCKNGALLDGFPRTLEQAKEQENIFKEFTVVTLEVDRTLLIKRVLGRRVCARCGTNYNLTTHETQEVCDCGGELFIRNDDNAETFKRRLQLYDDNTAPLIDYYKKKGKLISICGLESSEAVFAQIKIALDKLNLRTS